jgi:predicted amidophosphoribosyltransferase
MSITALLLPSRCAGCGALGASPCATCAASLRPPPLLDPPEGLDGLSALVRYDEVARALVTAVKYRNARSSIDGLAPALAALAPRLVADGSEDPDRRVVTWAPTTSRRARHRGFDQAELLARAIARELGLPVHRCLRRLPGAHQTGRGADERRAGPRFAAAARAPPSVLVVDDVCTTGATLSAAAAALRGAGAATVQGLVIARTPARQVHR